VGGRFYASLLPIIHFPASFIHFVFEVSQELSDRGFSISINKLVDEMSRIKRINTFFGDLKKPERVTSYTLGTGLAQQIEETYRLKEKYS